MSVRTVFLARLFGLYCLIMAAALLSQSEAFVTIVHALMADAPLVLIAGVFTLFGGLAIVLLHNYWSGGALTIIITLLGWLTLIKAGVLVALPSTKIVAMYGYPVIRAREHNLWIRGVFFTEDTQSTTTAGYRARDGRRDTGVCVLPWLSFSSA
jgi:hypothetical protein